MQKLILRPSPWRHLGLLAVSSAFVAIGVTMIRDGQLTGWLAAGFFGLGVGISLLNLMPGASFLALDEQGPVNATETGHATFGYVRCKEE